VAKRGSFSKDEFELLRKIVVRYYREAQQRMKRYWHQFRGLDFRDQLLISSQGVIAIATMAYVAVSIGQGCALRTTNKISIASNAPHVSVQGASLPDKVGNTWVIWLPYKNSGQWIAHFVERNIVAIQGKVAPTTMPTCKEGTSDAIPVGHDEGYRWTIPITPTPNDQDIAAIKDGSIGLWILGCITYRDAFNNRLVTPVCEQYDAKAVWYPFCQVIANKPPRPEPNAEPNKPPAFP
jgi:hypothetical protein